MGCSNDNYWKLDKWDKIGIASLIVFFTIFVVLNTFSFGANSENVKIYKVSGLSFNDTSSVFSPSGSTSFVGYFPLDNRYIYHISSTGDTDFTRYFGLSDSIPSPGKPVEVISTYSSPFSFDYYPNSSEYLYFNYYYGSSVTVTRTLKTDFNGVAWSLVHSLSISSFWSVFNNVIPYILVVVLVSFGIYLISHAIRGISKGRDV